MVDTARTTRRVALVMPVHNRRETTLRALRSLEKIDRTGISLKLIIVDDGSTDGTSDAIRSDIQLDVEIVEGDGTLHYAAGTNRGIEKALELHPDYIVTMNDDSVFHRDFLVRLVQTAQAYPKAVIGSLLLLWDQPHRVFQVDPKWEVSRAGWVFPDDLTALSVKPEPFEVQCIVGNCVLFPVEAIKKNGLMDEVNFPNGWGDAQYTVRMKKNGWKLLLEPRSLVWCEPNSYPVPLHQTGYVTIMRNVFLDRNHPSNLVRQFKALWYSAPTKPQALAAFSAYAIKLGMKGLGILPPAENGQRRG